MNDGGKGSKPRPFSVSQDEYANRFDAIFGKKEMTTFTTEDRMRSEKFDLVKYRDAGMNTYTYFWKDKNGKTVSPFFNSESEAHGWMDLESYKLEAQSLWSDSCTTPRSAE